MFGADSRSAALSAARGRTAGNRKCHYEGRHCCVPRRGRNSRESPREGKVFECACGFFHIGKYYCNQLFPADFKVPQQLVDISET